MLFAVLFVILFIVAAYFVYQKGHENEHFFETWKIKYSRPTFIFGHSLDLMMMRKNIVDYINGLYQEFPGEKANGIWDMRSPSVVVRDPQLAKYLAVKEFDHFMDHKKMIDDTMDSYFGNTLVALTGQKWKDMRATLSPAFTGSKMRLMFELIAEVTEQLMDYMRGECAKTGVVEMEMKDLCSKFTNDVIALCAFGIKVDSLKDKNNDFYRTGKDVMDFGNIRKAWKFFGYRFAPKLMKTFDIELLSPQTKGFFSGMVLESMAYREKNKIFRPDMINLLMDVRKGALNHDAEEDKSHDSAGFATVDESDIGKQTTKRQWTDDEIIAQCFIFFLAGFDTSSTVMSFAALELTANPDIQERLYEEVKSVREELNGKQITYEILQGMKYLDMVVSETLRKWPPAPGTDRICNKPFEYKDEAAGLSMHFETGTSVVIPIYGYHHDPQYFPEPEKFNPDRFSDENKHLINMDAYLPFGIGPRNCIGSRFALMEVKALLYYLVLNFSFEATQKTEIPYVIKKSFGSIAKDIFIGLKLRSE